jgi:hypothetical protein
MPRSLWTAGGREDGGRRHHGGRARLRRAARLDGRCPPKRVSGRAPAPRRHDAIIHGRGWCGVPFGLGWLARPPTRFRAAFILLLCPVAVVTLTCDGDTTTTTSDSFTFLRILYCPLGFIYIVVLFHA